MSKRIRQWSLGKVYRCIRHLFKGGITLKKIVFSFAIILGITALFCFPASVAADVSVRSATLDLSDESALSALAAEDGVTVEDGVYTSDAQGWSYDTQAVPKTLTLSGVDIQASSGDFSYGIVLPSGSKIVLAEGTTNKITCSNAVYDSAAVFSQGDLSIEGSGELIATGGTAPQHSYGIYADGALAIGGGELTLLGGTAGSSYGIFTNGAIEISECTVTATGGTFSVKDATGIASEAGGITIDGANTTVIATGGDASLSSTGENDIKNSMGIYALGGDVYIGGNAVVDANGAASENETVSYCGIHLNKSFQDGSGGTLTITGNANVTAGGVVVNMQNGFGGAACIVSGNAKVSIEAPDAMEGESSGLSMTNGYFMLSDGAAVTIHAGQGKYGSFGMIFGVDSESAGQNAGEKDGMLIMTGGTLEVKSSLARNSRAIVAKIGMEISGGTLVVQSDEASDGDSTGLFSGGKINISGTTDLTAKSGTATSMSAAVYADGGITLGDALVILSPEDGSISGDGLYIASAEDDYATDVHIGNAAPEFNDIPQDAFYYHAVAWAVANKITTGTGGGNFSPARDCTRGEIVTFLWRSQGRPDPVTTVNPFSDVKEDDDYYKAVLWAYENGITDGTSDTTFSPGNTCTRGQAVTFLWRTCGKPDPTAASGFTDVPDNMFYTNAVSWAVEQKITDGTGGGAFSPNVVCSRGQIVTFLYRTFAE